jgi:hypothetical protein
MRNDISKIIKEIYCNNNKNLFLEGCNKKIDFLSEFIELLRKYSSDITFYDDVTEPALEIRISVNTTITNEIEIQYDSLLYINKIVDYFFLQHEFSIDNPDINGIEPSLDGFSEEPYNRMQFDLNNLIEDYLSKKKYKRLSRFEMNEIFPGIRKFPDREELYQMNVNNALFMDLWDLSK